MKAQHERLGEVLLPDFLLVGAAKSATSSLYAYLNQHPDIRMSKIKENWFFSFVNNPPDYTSPGVLNDVVFRVDDYLELYQGARAEQSLGDASPSYLYTYRDAIKNIQSIYPSDCLHKLRIIISLREPVSRAFSQYWTFKRRSHEPLTFEEAIEESTIRKRLDGNWNIFYDYVGFGNYYEPVKAYLDAFGQDKVLILLYDDIQEDTASVCQSIFTFLGVDSSFVPDVDVQYNNMTGEPTVKWLVQAVTSRNPIKRALVRFIPKKLKDSVGRFLGNRLLKRGRMLESTRRKLVHLYAEDIRRLETLINRDLSHWMNDD